MHIRLFALYIIFSWATPLFAAEPKKIDITQGQIDGRTAVAFAVVQGIGSRDIIDPIGFEVHLIPSSDRDKELVYPAGSWFQPPDGKFKYWLEAPGWVTPYSSTLIFRSTRFTGKGSAGIVPVIPAGILALDSSAIEAEPISMRALHLDSHNRAPFPQKEFSRRANSEKAHQGVLMPEGSVVAAVFDHEAEEYAAISRPVVIKASSESRVRPESPRKFETQLLVRLERPKFRIDHGEADMTLQIQEQDGTVKPPAVFVSTATRVYAIWYDLHGKYATLKAESPTAYLPDKEIVLRPGKVETYYGHLKLLPSVNVQINLPKPLSTFKVPTLEIVTGGPDRKKVREIVLPRDTWNHKLKSVPAKAVVIRLHIPPWTFRKQMDLSDGLDRNVYFEPKPITVAGHVYRGKELHSATIEFQVSRKGDMLRVSTDDGGFYTAELFCKGYYIVNVQLDGVEGSPYTEFLDNPITKDIRLDFNIPDNEYKIRVLDAKTGQGIEGAQVTVGNSFVSSGVGSPVREGGREKNSASHSITDSMGLSKIRPLNDGELTLRAKAKGYITSDPIKEEVTREVREREITVTLEPIEDPAAMQLLLPSGLPAGGADVSVQHSLDNVRSIWSGQADSEGLIRIPRHITDAFILVRHPAAGYLIRKFLSVDDLPTGKMPISGSTLAVAVKRPGGNPAPWSSLALYVDNFIISGQTLAWLTGRSTTDAQGYWIAQNLPAAPFRILAWPRGQDSDIRSLESFFVDIPFPRQETFEIQTLN